MSSATGLTLTPVPQRRRQRPPRHLADLAVEERAGLAQDLGVPALRIKQIARHYFARHDRAAGHMTDLPANGREELVAAVLPELLHPVRTLEADSGMTRKTLWRLFDGALVESVLMGYSDRATLCVSSQAGCAMACPFCATGKGGLERNLSTAEIVDQVVDAASVLERGMLADSPARLSNIVFMGMGEPLANYKSLLGALRTMVAPAPNGLGLSARNITVSTVGLVPRIRQLAQEQLPVTLALSLHAPDDELRDELVPINTRFTVQQTVEAAWEYARATRRRVSIEYAMMRGINDQAWRADMLAEVLNGFGDDFGDRWGWVHVNVIPLNEVPGSRFTRSSDEDTKEFVHRLRAEGISTTVRDTRGSDIDAACGQLAALEGEPSPDEV